MSDEVVWAVVAGAFLVGEMLTLDLTLVMFALAALVAAGLALAGVDVIVQIIAFAVTAAGCTFGLRPLARRHLTRGPELRTGAEALVGSTAVVLERVDGVDGRVRLAGEVWSARSFPAGEVLDVGSTVRVLRIDGARVVVHRGEDRSV